MLETLRRPLLVIALILFILALGLDLGSSLLPASNGGSAVELVVSKAASTDEMMDLDESDRNEMMEKLRTAAAEPGKPPGKGILAMGLVDGIVVYGLVMLVLPIFISQEFHGRLYGIVTLIFGIVMLILAIVLVITTFIETMIMVALLMAAPFGTIAYLAIWGFFNRGGAEAILTISMFLKVIFAILLVLAHPRFLQSKGLVLMVLTSFVCILLISFLHGFVPIFLVSITDAIAAIVIGIIAAIWAIVLLIGGIVGAVKAIA